MASVVRRGLAVTSAAMPESWWGLGRCPTNLRLGYLKRCSRRLVGSGACQEHRFFRTVRGGMISKQKTHPSWLMSSSQGNRIILLVLGSCYEASGLV